MTIIAVSGWKNSGKDTLADYLVLNHNFMKGSFADELKHEVCRTYDLSKKYVYNQQKKEEPLPQYPIITKDKFSEQVHNILEKEFRDYKVEYEDAIDFIKCWTPRALLILEGSIKRSVNPNYWVDKVIERIRLLKHNNICTCNNFVISDLRYRSEIERLKQEFGEELTTVRINRFTEVNSTDASERDLDGFTFDKTINNNSSLMNFYAAINELMEEFENGQKV